MKASEGSHFAAEPYLYPQLPLGVMISSPSGAADWKRYGERLGERKGVCKREGNTFLCYSAQLASKRESDSKDCLSLIAISAIAHIVCKSRTVTL